MAKQYRKESLGRIDGSLSSRGVFTIPHSPEQEQNLQRLMDQMRSLLMPVIQQAITIAVDENWEIHEGDVIQYIVNYITNYFKTYKIGQTLVAGNGIRISGDTVSVRDGKGLVASGDLDIELDTDPGLEFSAETAAGKLRAKPDNTKAIDKGAGGIKLVRSSNVETGAGSGGGGLSFDATSPGSGVSGLRVNPEDFLYLGPP